MDWTLALIVAVGIAAGWFLKRSAFVAEARARQLLSSGALLLDVRSPEEFRRGHVPGALNVPLGQVRNQISHHTEDKSQALLVHCQSGGRSAIAAHQLKSLGYTQVFNLGSLKRAQRLGAARQTKRAPRRVLLKIRLRLKAQARCRRRSIAAAPKPRPSKAAAVGSGTMIKSAVPNAASERRTSSM